MNITVYDFIYSTKFDWNNYILPTIIYNDI